MCPHGTQMLVGREALNNEFSSTIRYVNEEYTGMKKYCWSGEAGTWKIKEIRLVKSGDKKENA